MWHAFWAIVYNARAAILSFSIATAATDFNTIVLGRTNVNCCAEFSHFLVIVFASFHYGKPSLALVIGKKASICLFTILPQQQG